MCGRFAIDADPRELELHFELERTPLLPPRFNVCPGTKIPVVGRTTRGHNELHFLEWGFLPAWTEELGAARRLINARSESVHEKPAFASAFRERRCLVPAVAYYEWQGSGKQKRPFAVRRPRGQRLFGMAGIWQLWTAPNGGHHVTCAILTREADGKLRDVHPRMPVVIPMENYERWLSSSTAPSELQERVLASARVGADFEHYAVDPRVGDVRQDDAALLEPYVATERESEIRSLFE